MKVLGLDEIEGIPVFGALVRKPVRKTLGVTAFGINAYTAANAGDEVVEEHTEPTASALSMSCNSRSTARTGYAGALRPTRISRRSATTRASRRPSS